MSNAAHPRAWAAVLSAALLVAAAPAHAVEGPSIAMAPAAGKPPDLFAAEADFCRSEADSRTATEPQESTIVGSAVVGTVLGAAVGSVFSSRRHDRTAAGAVSGLIVGTAAGANRSAVNEAHEQQRYDAAYEQCMLGKGNLSPRFAVRQAAVPAYAAPPPPLARSSVPPPNTPPPPALPTSAPGR